MMSRVLGFLIAIRKDGLDGGRFPLFDDKECYLIGGKDCSVFDIQIKNANEDVLCKICIPQELCTISIPKEFDGKISMEVLSTSVAVVVNSESVEGKVYLKHDDIIFIADSMLKFATIHGYITDVPVESEQSPYHRLRAHILLHMNKKSSEEEVLSCLKISIPRCSDNNVQSLMSLTHDEKTLLTNACKVCEKDLVFYLVNVCKGDVNFSEGVKYPALHSAILGRNKEIVQFLLSHGADASLVDAKGFKPLFHAYGTEDDHSVEIVKLLVKNGANLNSAVIEGRGKNLEWRMNFTNEGKRNKLNNRIEYKEGKVVQLIASYFNWYIGEDEHPLIYNALHNNMEVFFLMIQSYETVLPGSIAVIPESVSADAFDIYGATLAVRFDFEDALLFWDYSMRWRFNEDEKPIYKENVREARSLFDNENEILYREDFDELSSNSTPIKILTQAVLIYERILPTYTENYFQAFSALIDRHLEEGHYKRVLELHIELQKTYCIAAHTRFCFRLFDECADSISKMLGVLKDANWTPSFEEKMLVCEQSYHFLHSNVIFHKTYNLPVEDLAFTCCIASIRFIWNLLETSSLNEKELFEKFMIKLISSDFRNESGQSLLHRSTDVDIVTFSDHMSVLNCPNFTNFDVLEVLLKFGYDPNDVDNEGNTALHLLAEFIDCSEITDEDYDAVDLLVRYGSHLDSPNKKGKTVIDLMKVCGFDSEGFAMRSLQCCAASVVVKHGLMEEIEMPDFLHKFIKLHQVPT